MTEPLSCPYCNALVVPPAGARAGQRVPCARCGETFTLSASFETADDGRGDVPPSEAPPVALPPVRRWPNALVAAIVVGSMMLLAALVLRFAVFTKDERRNNDLWPARPERVPLRFVLSMLTVLVSAGVTVILIRRRSDVPGGPENAGRFRVAGLAFLWGSAAVTVAVLLMRGSGFQDDGTLDPVRPTAPADLEGLRYLPGDTNVLAAMHVGEILENPDREKLLNLSLPRLGASPDLGTVRGMLDRLEQMTKLRREVIDHLVLGVKLSEKDTGRIQLVVRVQLIVRTRKNYDKDRLRVALKTRTHPVIEARERGIFQFHHDLLPGLSDGLLVCPNKRTIILGWGVTRLSDMDKEPRKNSDHLPVPIRAILKERVRPWGQVWVAGHLEEWPKPLLPFLALARVGEQDRQLLSKLKTFAVWLDLEQQRALHAALRCVDGAAAKAVESALASQFRQEGKPDPRLSLVRNDEWVTLQFRIEK